MLRDLKHIAATMRSTRHASGAYVLRSLLLAAAFMQMAEGTIILMVRAFTCSVLLAGKSLKLFSPLAKQSMRLVGSLFVALGPSI